MMMSVLSASGKRRTRWLGLRPAESQELTSLQLLMLTSLKIILEFAHMGYISKSSQ